MKKTITPSYRKNLIIYLLLAGIFIGVGYTLYSLTHGNLPFLTKPNSVDNSKSFAENQAQQIYENCNNGQKGELCYADQFGELTKKYDLEQVLKTLSAIQDIDPQTRGCHLLAHSISAAETAKDPSMWEEILTKFDPNSCTGGFIHGVIEAHSVSDPNFHLDSQSLGQLCSLVAQKTGQGGEFNCAHIMGHILLAVNVNDIPKALDVCQGGPESMQYECFSGVFMENETRDNLVAHRLVDHIPWNKQTTQDQEDICHKYSGVMGRACWREISHMYSFISIDNPSLVYQLCNKAPTSMDQDDCYFHSVGIMTASFRFDLSNSKDLCNPFINLPQKYQQCISYSTNSMILSSPKFADRVITLCESVPQNYRKGCYQNLGERLSQVASVEERKKLCTSAPADFRSYCEGS